MTQGTCSKVRVLARDTRGANLVEYIILVGVVAILCIAGFRAFGTAVVAKTGEQAGTVSGESIPGHEATK